MPRPFRITDVLAKTLVFAAIGLIHVTVPSRLLAQGAGGAELRPVRITTPPKLDGILDDEAWSGDPLPLEGWSSYNPMRGEAPAEKTQVWMGYDTEALYFAFRCLDTQPEKIRTTISRRDNAFSDDWVGVSLDSSRAGQLAYHLFVNPSGIQMDALQSGSGGEDFAPDLVWQSAGHVGARRMVCGDSRPAREHSLSQRHRRANGRVVLATPQPHWRLGIVARNGGWQMGVRVERNGRIRRASVSTPARNDSQLRPSPVIRRGPIARGGTTRGLAEISA